MDFGYIVKGKHKENNWKSKIYFDANEMSKKFNDCASDKDYSDIKQFNVYIHYEEFEENH